MSEISHPDHEPKTIAKKRAKNKVLTLGCKTDFFHRSGPSAAKLIFFTGPDSSRKTIYKKWAKDHIRTFSCKTDFFSQVRTHHEKPFRKNEREITSGPWAKNESEKTGQKQGPDLQLENWFFSKVRTCHEKLFRKNGQKITSGPLAKNHSE